MEKEIGSVKIEDTNTKDVFIKIIKTTKYSDSNCSLIGDKEVYMTLSSLLENYINLWKKEYKITIRIF